MKNTMWYAVMRDNDDTDWGTGSNNMDKAIEMAKKYRAEGSEDAEIPSQRISDLGALWDVSHVTIRDLRAHTGLTRTAFALRYLIPYRTVENWERGDSQCPDYVRLLLAQVTGFYRRPEA